MACGGTHVEKDYEATVNLLQTRGRTLKYIYVVLIYIFKFQIKSCIWIQVLLLLIDLQAYSALVGEGGMMSLAEFKKLASDILVSVFILHIACVFCVRA
jgi:hypothetical protein